MGQLRTLAIVGAGLAASVVSAWAADAPGNRPYTLPPPAQARPLQQTSIYPAWYLRGDLGYRWGRVGGVEVAPGFIEPTDRKLGGAAFAGLGVGLKTEWLRTDVTVDIDVPAKYEATTFTSNDTTAKVSAFTALFNGYLDLGTWYRATPYIGAGAGTARVRISDFQSTAAPPFTGDSSHSQWNLAWAAMAGVAYQVSPNMQIDVGYRYLNVGDVATASDPAGSTKLKNIANHEVRVGLRWSFDDLPITR